VAAHYDRRDVVEELLASGAELNAKTEQGETPLQLAHQRRNQEMVALLRQRGAEER